MTMTETVLYRDDLLVALDVRCRCHVGCHDEEEETDAFEVVLPLAGAFVRRTDRASTTVDAAFGYVARPASSQTITHLTAGDRCIAVQVTEVAADELGLDRDSAAVVFLDRRRQRQLAFALNASAGDLLAAGEAWLAVVAPTDPFAYGRTLDGARVAAVERVREAIRSDIAATWTLRQLARVAGYSPHHLSRMFASTTGMTVSEYRDRVRLGRAMHLLRDGMRAADVANEVGYFDHGHLTRRTTDVLGQQPSSLRR